MEGHRRPARSQHTKGTRDYPVIRSVERERLIHQAELRQLQNELELRAKNEEKLWTENNELRNVLNHLPDTSSMDQFARRIEELEAQNDSLEDEICRLQGLTPSEKDELRRTMHATHPRNTIDPQEVEAAYGYIQDAIRELVADLVGHLEEDELASSQLMREAIEGGGTSELLEWMEWFPDLAKLTSFGLASEHALRALINLWLDYEIFSTDLYGAAPHVSHVIRYLEQTLNENVTPRYRPIELRRWRQTVYIGVINNPDYVSVREQRKEALATQFLNLLSFLPATREEIYSRLFDEIVDPAVRLHESILTSIDVYKFEFRNFTSSDIEGYTTSVDELYHDKDRIQFLDLLNISFEIDVKNKRQGEVRRNLDPICTLTPSIVCQFVDEPVDDQVCYESTIAVSWGPPKVRNRKWDRQVPSFLNIILEEDENQPQT